MMPPECDVYHKFCQTVNMCMRKSGFSRVQLADRMNYAATDNSEVEQVKLNKWFAPSQPQHTRIVRSNSTLMNSTLTPILINKQ